MKFGKDEIQKIALSVLLLIGLLYIYFFLLLKPLRTSETVAAKEFEELQPKLRAARGQLTQTAALEAEAPAAADTYAEIVSLIPEGSPIAWFPPKIVDFFQRQGIPKTSVRLVREQEAKDLAGFRRLSWMVDLREVEFVPLGIAIAALESEEPLIQIHQLQIQDSDNDVEKQNAVLHLSNIVKK